MIAKFISIKVQGYKFGRCVAKAAVLTWKPEWCPGFGTEGVVRLPDRHSGVSRGHSRVAARRAERYAMVSRIYLS
jgi:hypothetical protein